MLNFNQNIYANITYLGCASEYIDDIWENIEQIDLLHSFSHDEVKAICRYLDCYAAPRGYILFEPQSQSDHLILVLSGSVSVSEFHGGVEESTEFDLGASFGESSLVDQQPWHVTGVTILPTDFAILTRDALNQMLIVHPRLANKLLLVLMRKIALRLRSLDAPTQFESAHFE